MMHFVFLRGILMGKFYGKEGGMFWVSVLWVWVQI